MNVLRTVLTRRLRASACLWAVAVCTGCAGPYLTRCEDPVRELMSPDPNLAALAALEVAASDDPALSAASLPTLCELLHHRDPLVRSAAARALRTITGAATNYRPFRDPLDQEESILQWQDLVERVLEAPQ